MSGAITDWDKEYANAASVPDAQSFIDKWPDEAASFREKTQCTLDIAYGSGERQKFDLFEPQAVSKGLFVFVHGGYWYRFDKSFWSQFAAGPLALGWHVAMPSYTLTPKAQVSDISREISRAISAAAGKVNGPIVLAGHSAGGHLVTRQVCSDTKLDTGLLQRIRRVISISGVHDLRPITRLELNQTIGLDAQEAASESPALLKPYTDNLRVDCVVGGIELPEFKRQNSLLANIWRGLGASTSCQEIPGTHHFNVIEDLANPEGLICSLAED
ncbi:MAG: alpha/beta hydrolase [Rhizobiaceae bacterium]|nr:alpha/beta hydrolase [Rhizobiaceae bacterium]